MPRSGTTLLAHLLDTSINTCSYNIAIFHLSKYQFYGSILKNVLFWNKKIQRPHGDKMEINLNSPDSFEEMFWSENLANYNSGAFCKFLEAKSLNSKLEFKLKNLFRNVYM